MTQLSQFADCFKSGPIEENSEALAELRSLETKAALPSLLSGKPKMPELARKISGKVFSGLLAG